MTNRKLKEMDMKILKTGLMVVVAVLSLAQTSIAQAEGMNLLRYSEEEKHIFIGKQWEGRKEVWVGKYVGKNHRLVTVDFQGATITLREQRAFGIVGARITETRYYSNTGYVYAKFALDGNTDFRSGEWSQTWYFWADVNYSISVYDGTSATNAKNSY